MTALPALTLRTGHFELDRAFQIALGDVAGNVRHYQSGLLERPEPCLMAGLSYPDPWTRDASINAWNGIGLLIPEVAKNTLLSCLSDGRQPGGYGSGCGEDTETAAMGDQLRIGGQYWDRIIWAIGAWSCFCQSGDQHLLQLALTATTNSLRYLEETEWNPEKNLFRGGACFHDGISAYGDVYTEQNSTNIMDWARDNPNRRHPTGVGVPIYALSTNCLYAEAYRVVQLMAQQLGQPVDPHWAQMQQAVTAGIQERLWHPSEERFRFYLDPYGGGDERQESLGNAFALLFDLVASEQAEQVMEHQPQTRFGPPSIWPDWKRYKQAKLDQLEDPPNRPDIALENQMLRGCPEATSEIFAAHGGTVWPFIMGFLGEAMLRHGRPHDFAQQLDTLATQFCTAVQAPEVVHPHCGLPYGGVQEAANRGPIQRVVSCYRQTWSATALIRLVLFGVVGLRCQPDRLAFDPYLPENFGSLTLRGLPWRQATLDVHIELGQDDLEQTTLSLDGDPQPEPSLPADLSGLHRVEIQFFDRFFDA